MTLVSLADTVLCLPNIFRHDSGMTEQWARLAEAVAKRRAWLKLSQDNVRALGGPSDVVQSRIENNEEPRPRGDTLHKLDGPLQWVPGSAVAVLAGGDPIPVGAARTVRDASTDELLDEIRRRIEGARRGLESTPQPYASSEAQQAQEVSDSSKPYGGGERWFPTQPAHERRAKKSN